MRSSLAKTLLCAVWSYMAISFGPVHTPHTLGPMATCAVPIVLLSAALSLSVAAHILRSCKRNAVQPDNDDDDSNTSLLGRSVSSDIKLEPTLFTSRSMSLTLSPQPSLDEVQKNCVPFAVFDCDTPPSPQNQSDYSEV